MNWLLPAVLLFLLIAAGDGHRKGFIKKSVGLVSWGVTFLVTSIGVPYIAEFLKEKTELHRVLQNTIAASDAQALEVLEMLGQSQTVSGQLADGLLRVIAFLITLLLVSVLVRGIAFSLGIVAKLPILNGLNKKAGLLLGLVEGVLVVWIFFFVVTVCISTETGVKLLLMISESEILSWIYRHNLLFAFLAM